METRRGGMWGEVDRRSLKGVRGKEACAAGGAKGLMFSPQSRFEV